MCSIHIKDYQATENTNTQEIQERRAQRSMLLIKHILDITETEGIGMLKSHSCIIPGEDLHVNVLNDITSH